MPQTFWESEVEERAETTKVSGVPADEPESLALSADDFSALEERVIRAVELVKRERQARLAAEERAAKAEGQLTEHAPALAQMKDEVRTLRRERDQVRQRIDRLLSQLDSLEL
ncbi:MAG: hypothetical protein WBD67_02945 [Terracidiphilus sp.]